MTIRQYATNNLSGSYFDFFSITSHGTIYEDPWEFTDSDEVFYGVQGMQQTLDKVHGRVLRLTADLYGYSTEALLKADLNTLNSYINDLKGPLVINSTMTYNNMVFKGFQMGMPIQYFGGGAGQAGWGAFGLTLVWRQLKP